MFEYRFFKGDRVYINANYPEFHLFGKEGEVGYAYEEYGEGFNPNLRYPYRVFLDGGSNLLVDHTEITLASSEQRHTVPADPETPNKMDIMLTTDEDVSFDPRASSDYLGTVDIMFSRGNSDEDTLGYWARVRHSEIASFVEIGHQLKVLGEKLTDREVYLRKHGLK